MTGAENCLVTGGTGFLGQHVVNHLLETGGRVTVLSRAPAQSGVETVLADLGAPAIDLGRRRYAIVYHLAGLAHRVPRTGAERELFFHINVGGTKNLVAALERSGALPRAVVLISTVAVYGVEAGTLLDETTPRRALDPYGASKREAEDFLMEWGARNGVLIAAARLPLVAGRNAPGNLGAMVRALRRHRYFGVGAGAARRSVVLARDVAQILPRMARQGGTYHLTDGDHPSFAELEQALSTVLKRKSPPRLPTGLARLGARCGDLVHGIAGLNVPLTTRSLTKMLSTLTFSDERARATLGWQPARVVDHAAEIVG